MSGHSRTNVEFGRSYCSGRLESTTPSFGSFFCSGVLFLLSPPDPDISDLPTPDPVPVPPLGVGQPGQTH